MIVQLICCLASAALWYTGSGLHPVWWATWLAPLPVLWVARQAKSGWVAAGCVFAAWCLGSLNQWTYLTKQIQVPIVPVLMALIIPSLVVALAAILWRGFARRDAPIRAALVLACVWVAFEFLQQRTSPHSTFGSLAYSQVDFLPVLQVASLAGLAGINFLLFFVPGTIATGRLRAIAPALLLLAGSLWWGRERLNTPFFGERVPVALIASDRYPRTVDEQRQLLREYAEHAGRLVSGGAKFVVIPEKIAVIKEIPIEEIDELFGSVAKQGARVEVGLERWTPAAKLNEARVYGTNGALEAVYEKHHMLPPMESHLLVGHERVDLPGRTGVEICKDMDFPALSREYGGQDDAGLMIVPAWDFHSDGWLHSRMAVVRGVESGFGLVRSAKEGLMTVSDSRGRVLAEQRSDAAAFSELVAEAHVARERTLYARYGDWFAWTSVVALAALLVSWFIDALRNGPLPPRA